MGSQHRQLPILIDRLLEPLRPLGEGTFSTGDELLVRSEDARLQPYPGHTLPELGSRTRFPIPDRPGEYCAKEEFLQAPKYMAQFVHWPEHLELVLEGRYFELPPVHFEGIFTLVCNFMCPHCTRRVTRNRWVERRSWDNNTEVDTKNTLHPQDLRRALDEAASLRTDRQMGIIWGGGDPTGNPFTYDGMLYARSLGITSSVLTNGVFLDVDRALDADPILIRISLNCGTEETYRKFHGYPAGWDYFERVQFQIKELARRKLERKARTLIGISLIMDERNLDDMSAAAEIIRRTVEEAGGGIDYVIVRPVMQYKHFEGQWAKLNDDTKERAKEFVEDGGVLKRILDSCGVPLVPIKDSFEPPPAADADFYEDGRCLSYGVCAEIRHNGDVQLCSDSYGNPEFTIGNLLQSSLKEIWSSNRRREVLERRNEAQCFKNYCPHNSRGHHYNRLFHRIEKKRSEGKIEEVRRWAAELREVTHPLLHSFFI
jgi:radical SAM protein with 4Fe4S-binding SPASM domain